MKKIAKILTAVCLLIAIIFDLYILMVAFKKPKLPSKDKANQSAKIDLSSIKEAIEITKMTLTIGNDSLPLNQDTSTASAMTDSNNE